MEKIESREAGKLDRVLQKRDIGQYGLQVKRHTRNFLEYPRIVSIETLVKCNAACSFCPYPTSDRKDERMSDELFEKIIQDLADIPEDHKFSITLARINEPLLDRRLKDFSTLIGEKLPNATQLFWSNGSTLKPGKFEWVSQFPGANLTISLNSVEEKAHTDLMGFGLKNVIRNLDYMHGQKAQGAFDIQVRLTATHQGQKESTEFVDYCTDRWPLFNVSVTPYFTWQGDIAAGQLEAKAAGSSDHDLIMNSGLACGQWFDLHILANGRATKCCIDEAGHKSIEFDLSRNHALEVFRQTRQLRQSTPDRRKVPGCEECSHLG